MTEEEKEFFAKTISGVMAEHLATVIPESHHKHHEFIDALMGREARRAKLHEAIIEKSLAGLVWASMVGIGLAVWEWIKAHVR